MISDFDRQMDGRILDGLRREGVIAKGQNIGNAERVLSMRRDLRAELLRIVALAEERLKRDAGPNLTGRIAGVRYGNPDSYLNAARAVLLDLPDYRRFIVTDETPVQKIPFFRLLRLKMCADFLSTRQKTNGDAAVKKKTDALNEELKQRIGRCLNHMGANLDAKCVSRLEVKALVSSASLDRNASVEIDSWVLIVIPDEIKRSLKCLDKHLYNLGIPVDYGSRVAVVRALPARDVNVYLKECEKEDFVKMVCFALDLLKFVFKELRAELDERQRISRAEKEEWNRTEGFGVHTLENEDGSTIEYEYWPDIADSADTCEGKDNKTMMTKVFDCQRGITEDVIAKFGVSAEEAHSVWVKAITKFINPAYEL